MRTQVVMNHVASPQVTCGFVPPTNNTKTFRVNREILYYDGNCQIAVGQLTGYKVITLRVELAQVFYVPRVWNIGAVRVSKLI